MQKNAIKDGGFFTRLIINALVIWLSFWVCSPDYVDSIAGGLLGKFAIFLVASLFFSIVNTLVRPILTFLSIPAILLTFGLFTFVVNGLVLYIVLALTPNISITLGEAIVVSIVMSLINYLITNLLSDNKKGA